MPTTTTQHTHRVRRHARKPGYEGLVGYCACGMYEHHGIWHVGDRWLEAYANAERRAAAAATEG